MIEPAIIIVNTIFSTLGGGFWGWGLARHRQTPITTQSIEAYIAKTMPDSWSAYKKGVHEGYEQGLRDGQELPNESS